METLTGLIDLGSKDTREDLDWHEKGEKKIKMKDLDSVLKSGGMKKCSTISEHTAKEEDSKIIDTNHIKATRDCSVEPIDASECGSTTGPTDECSPYKNNNEMKQLKRRKEEDSIKNIDLSRREHPAKYARNSAPSGLLSGLNPGIIKHVRNSKQVNSIIEAMLKFEKSDGENKAGTKDVSSHNHTVDRFDSNLSMPSYVSNVEHGSKGNESYYHGKLFNESYRMPQFRYGDDSFTVKLSSNNLSSTSNNTDLPASHDIKSLSIKGALIASQWLDILQQDIKGRLGALRRSRKRVRNVLQTELPYLTSKELMCDGAILTMHMKKWKSIFSQMESSLYEEGKNLENWLKQVRDMKSHCEEGLNFYRANRAFLLTEEFSGLKTAEVLEKEIAVRAAAASISSTCKLMTKGNINVPCF